MLLVDRGEVGRALLERADAESLERLAVAAGMRSRWQRAADAVEAGLTSPAEIRRVLGFSNRSDGAAS
jgi:general secretion pathway protein E